jgi:hypothetical protein
MVGYAAGSIASGAVLARLPVRRKAFASLVAWTLYLPAYGSPESTPQTLPGVIAAGILRRVSQPTRRKSSPTPTHDSVEESVHASHSDVGRQPLECLSHEHPR